MELENFVRRFARVAGGGPLFGRFLKKRTVPRSQYNFRACDNKTRIKNFGRYHNKKKHDMFEWQKEIDLQATI